MSWWALDTVLKDQAIEADYYRSIPPVACPNDGEPLRIGPPRDSGILYCIYDGWQYPRDWNPNTMAGM